ncbi:hypothetical protein EUGRSUZ_G03179 [Eucalyptus grandis]|uniref:Uncharacterized protein n=2 Tax=Eucalyptus grandis TaxID=71139 RepID=A0ACC3K9L6_EUCGR|nr:hypothetical protein EUGRSUZ_G03179 [Eucalyptus grandis]
MKKSNLSSDQCSVHTEQKYRSRFALLRVCPKENGKVFTIHDCHTTLKIDQMSDLLKQGYIDIGRNT